MPRPDATNATRQARLRDRRRAEGLRRLMVWCTPEQAAAITAYLKGGARPVTDTDVTDTVRPGDVSQSFLDSLYQQIERLIEQRDTLQARLDAMENVIVTDTADELLNQHQAAAYLGRSVRSLQVYRKAGTGPAFHLDARNRAVYRRADLDAWKATRPA